MDAKERNKLSRQIENINLPEDELQKMQISMEIDLGGSAQDNPDKLQKLAEESKNKQEQEMAALLEKIKDKPEPVRQKILAQLKAEGGVASPFDISPEPESSPKEELQEAAPDEKIEEKSVERADAKVALRLTDDKMHAYVSMTPAVGGGRKPTAKMLEAYLRKKGVVYGLDKKKIEQAINQVNQEGNLVTDFEVATGKEVEAGTEGSVELLFEKASADDFQGELHMEDALAIGAVKKNDVLMKIIPSIPGRSGSTVMGEEIKAPEIEMLSVETKRNTRSAGDSIISDMDGIVYYYKDSVLVKPYADSVVDVKAAEDNMLVSVSLTPAVGDGLKLSSQRVLKALASRKVKFGIDEKSIADAVEKCEAESISLTNVPVARGKAAENGKDGRVVFKVRLEATHGLKQGQEERIDFREKDSIVNINTGTLLAVYYPPQPKICDGQDVFGVVIPGEDGAAVEISPGKNVEPKEAEGGLVEYYAKIDGQIVFDSPKLDVEPLFIVESDLNLEIGNIDFLGNVLIKGNVGDNFTVKAGGDIEVKGTVGASKLEAGRDIYVKNGVVTRETGELRAGANVIMRFAENSNVIAAGSIRVERAVLHSQIAAGGKILCKKEKGQIIGGHAIAREGIEVKELGTSTGTKTEVTIGMDFFKMEELNQLTAEQQKFEQAQEKILALLEKLAPHIAGENVNPDIKQKYVELMQKKLLVEKKLHEIKVKKIELSLEDEGVPACEMIVLKTLNTDVKINIGKHVLEITEAKEKQRIFPDPSTGQVMIEPYFVKKKES